MYYALQVFETRARSDAVVVGGETVRRDNPRLTTRREGGHVPMRIVMSRTLDLPQVTCQPCSCAYMDCWPRGCSCSVPVSAVHAQGHEIWACAVAVPRKACACDC